MADAAREDIRTSDEAREALDAAVLGNGDTPMATVLKLGDTVRGVLNIIQSAEDFGDEVELEDIAQAIKDKLRK